MSRLRLYLPRIAVFAVMVVVGFVVSSAVVVALQDRSPQTATTEAPDYVLAGAPDTPDGSPVPVAFDVEPSGSPVPLESLSTADLTAAADSLLGAEPAVYKNPSGFPRVAPISQFDGGPFQGANCTLTSGAMLARLAAGIVTSGSTLRTLQDDQDGGTDLNDLDQALWRGYGVSYPTGFLRPDQLKNLLAKGYGAVIQGDYSKIPRALRLQKDFLGGHAIYLDGYYPGNPDKGIPEAYYVIDPLGRPHSGYEGDWWPASVVDDFGTAFGGGHIPAMWAYPPGGVPPEVVGPDVLPIPHGGGGGGGGPTVTPEPGVTPAPGESASPSIPPVIEPGDVPPLTPAVDTPLGDEPDLGGVILIPILSICLVDPPPAGCPTGVPATFTFESTPVLQLAPGPTVTVRFVDSDRPNVAIVGFTVDPPGPATVQYWEHDGTPATIGAPSSMSSTTLFGATVQLAQLDVLASTTYDFQVTAGSGLSVSSSPVGQFTTGNGVEQFDVALSQAASPTFALQDGLSPYLHLAPGAFALPLVPLADLGGGCDDELSFGGTGYCADIGSGVAIPDTCTSARVIYALSGIDAEGVVVRAFPTEEGTTPEGDVSLEGVLEADGPAPSGEVDVGCLASGLSYHVVLDAIGDDRGILASEDVTVP
jgi:hypothetical protein